MRLTQQGSRGPRQDQPRAQHQRLEEAGSGCRVTVHGFPVAEHHHQIGGGAVDPGPMELVDRQLHEPFPDVRDLTDGVPATVSEAIAGATAKQPADRHPTVEAFLAALPSSKLLTWILKHLPIPSRTISRLLYERSLDFPPFYRKIS